MQSPGAIIIGGYVNGLGVVRALAARGVRIAVIRTLTCDIAHRSRHATDSESAFDIEENPEGLVEILERRAPDWANWAVLPTNDSALDALAQNFDRLSSHYRVMAPPLEIARHFLNKDLMLDDARTLGMDMPHCYGPATEETASLPGLRFPVVVKAVEGHRFLSRFGCKLFFARNRDELERCAALVGETELPCRVFDYVPGSDERIFAYCLYMGPHGDPSAGVTVRKIRQSPPLFGVARVAEVVEERANLREATVELLRRIGYRGFAAAEFKLDPRDGVFRFLEVNGRSVIYNELLRKAGLDVGGLTWSDFVEGRTPAANLTGWSGIWINFHADLLHSIFSRGEGRVGLREFLAPYGRRKAYAVWSARDPLPFMAQWFGTAKRGASAVIHGKIHELFADRAHPEMEK